MVDDGALQGHLRFDADRLRRFTSLEPGVISIHHLLKPERLRVYRCIADLIQLQDPTSFEPNLTLLYGPDTLRQALALVNQDERFFGLNTLGTNMEGSAMHRELLAAYRKVWA